MPLTMRPHPNPNPHRKADASRYLTGFLVIKDYAERNPDASLAEGLAEADRVLALMREAADRKADAWLTHYAHGFRGALEARRGIDAVKALREDTGEPVGACIRAVKAARPELFGNQWAPGVPS